MTPEYPRCRRGTPEARRTTHDRAASSLDVTYVRHIVTGTAGIVVVAGALILDGTLLIAQRERPPELAGLWELPGGKAAPGETDHDALIRELREELGVEVAVGSRLGADVALPCSMTLRAYLVTLVGGTVQAHDHRALRWVTDADLGDVDWVPADRGWVAALAVALSGGDPR